MFPTDTQHSKPNCKKLKIIYISFFLLYFLIWSIAPALLASSVPLDVSEGINWGSEFQWGYYKHPPLSSWVLFSFYKLFGHFGPYLLSQLCVILTLIPIYMLGKKIMGADRALLGSVLTLGVLYYSYPSLEFNHNVAQFPIWAGLSLLFYLSVTNNRYHDWVLLGLLGGLGMLTKYSVAFLLIPMALYLLLPNQWRLLKQPKPWLAALIMLALFAPHLYWLSQHEWLPFTYANGRSHDSNEGGNLAAHFSWMGFTLSQIIAHVPLLVMLIVTRKQLLFKSLVDFSSVKTPAANDALGISKPAPKPQTLSLISYLWFAPLLLLIVLSLIFGIGLRDMWGMPMWSLSGLLLAGIIAPSKFREVQSRLLKYIVIWLSIVTLLMITYLAFGQSLRDKPSRMDWPEQALSKQAYTTWSNISSCPLDSVSGDRWLGALVAMNTPSGEPWPSQMISGPANHSPWMTSSRLNEYGTLVLAQEEDEVSLPLLNTINGAQVQSSKDSASQAQSFDYYQGQWTLIWPHQPQAEPLVVNWQAFVPKSCAANTGSVASN